MRQLVRQLNFYSEGQLTPYREKLLNFTNLVQCWDGVKSSANWAQKLRDVASFNAANRWRKRGCSIAPVKYGASDDGYQSGAIVNICAEDGSVSVSTSGIEIGQGLNTKVAQAVAYKLHVPLSTVSVLPTETGTLATRAPVFLLPRSCISCASLKGLSLQPSLVYMDFRVVLRRVRAVTRPLRQVCQLR